jgi:predicted lipid-binding transport protein (Tim44 family)
MQRKWIRIGMIIVFASVFLTWSLELDAWARAGAGRSMGSRGSRSYSSPSRTYTAPQPTQPTGPSAMPSRPMTAPSPQPQPSFWRTFAAGALGGILGGMLFSSFGHGGGGFGGSGIGLFDILLIGALLYGIYWFIKRQKQREADAGAYYSTGTATSAEPQVSYGAVPGEDRSEADDLATGLNHIRSMDPSFDEKRFTESCTDQFFRVQGAWANRDMSSIRTLLTPEMYGLMQAETGKLLAEKRINKLDNIAVRTVEITEAWQEQGQDYVTVRFLANLLDYTTSESGELISGSKTEPVKFGEFWTFTRPVGSGTWQLSAINQVV